jgi:RHS repeat-associated protein
VHAPCEADASHEPQCGNGRYRPGQIGLWQGGDAATGLDYFGARYFSGAQGRYTTPGWSENPEPVPYADFSDPQTLNLYTYARNNPLSITDPDGHCPWCLGALIGGAGGAGAYYLTQRATNQPVTLRGLIAAGAGGAVTGATLGLATAPAAIGGLFTSTAIETGIAVKAGAAVGAGIAGGIVTRGIESGGDPNKSLGTLTQLGSDAAVTVGGEITGAILAPVVKAATTAGRAVTVGEEKLARGAKASPSLPERQLQLKTQQQVAGGAAGAGLDAAARSAQAEAQRRRAQEERKRQQEQR